MELKADFIERTRLLFGEERYQRFLMALEKAPIVSVRYNEAKHCMPSDADKVSWASSACYLHERPMFTADPLFHAGCYYVQEASSMFLEHVIKSYVDAPLCALDLCAAPGGKSTHLLSSLPQGSLLVANEPLPLRAQVLAENITKWGNPHAVVTRNEPRDFALFRGMFDLILVDAPCSGEGMFRKDAYAVEQWTQANVRQCAERQRQILSDVWDALRPGGLLVYSTCTFNREENEDCVDWIAAELGAEVLPVEVPSDWGITGSLTDNGAPVCRFIPGFTRGEGLFMALLRKNGSQSALQPRQQRIKPCTSKIKGIVASWIKDAEYYDFIMNNDMAVALPKKYTNIVMALQTKLKVLHAALPLAQIKNEKPIPHHALAMSSVLNRDAFNSLQVEREQALLYLHRESLTLPTAPIGFLLLTYRDVPLGFVKNVGNRANNMYPADWRIRKNPMEL
ncbi:MAG: rRNA cytosine-C5-methyltransferase [Bacteroidaceae bacterium]|nr:rRNA cytosine-C5-methyltransferase [Bacteroidaceae bacterium]